MWFRILTVIVFVFSGVFFLTNSWHPSSGAKVEKFDENIVLQLIHAKKEALDRFDMAKVKSLYSEAITTEFTDPDGVTYYGGYKELNDLLDDYARGGLGYHKTLLNHAVIVSSDGLEATVKMATVESWLFQDKAKNVSSNLLETEYWVLEEGAPKIVRIRKESGDPEAFFLQHRKDGSWEADRE